MYVRKWWESCIVVAFLDWMETVILAGSFDVLTETVWALHSYQWKASCDWRGVCQAVCKMSDHHQDRTKEIEFCEDRINIEFNDLCYYPPGKKGEPGNVSPAVSAVVTPRSTVLFDKLIATQLVKKFPTWNLKVNYRVRKNPPQVSILTQMYPVYAFPLFL
jgi:hypothetical protein